MKHIDITFDDCSLHIVNDQYSKSDIFLIDNITSEIIGQVTFNTIGSINHITELDEAFYIVNNCGYIYHDRRGIQGPFNDVFEIARIEKDLSRFKKMSHRYEDLYAVVGIFPSQHLLSTIIIFVDGTRIRCELVQYTRDLVLFKRRNIFTIRHNRPSFPHLSLRVIGYSIDQLLDLDQYLPQFAEYDNRIMIDVYF